ncbi:MAG: sulfite exporter TauE/SafE family protein [Bacillota bacterium]
MSYLKRHGFWVYGLLGLAAGLVNGLLGIGGGTVLIPGMVYLLGTRQHQAHATSLLIVLPTCLASILVYRRLPGVDLRSLWQLALYTSGGAIVGAICMNFCRPSLLRKGFGLFMLGTGLRMLF